MSVIPHRSAEGGLFSHYDAALEIGRPARKTTAGTPEKQLDTPLPPRECGPQWAIAAAALAAGTVRLVGGAVDAYNHRVDELNAQWRSAKAESFGVPAVSCPVDAGAEEIQAAAVVHADRLLDAKLELLSRLERSHGEVRRELDEAIATATARLAEGPTVRTMQDLLAAGVLPQSLLRAVSADEETLSAG
jgi:hypothetical protein